jgi:hypothetical protein
MVSFPKVLSSPACRRQGVQPAFAEAATRRQEFGDFKSNTPNYELITPNYLKWGSAFPQMPESESSVVQ